MPEASFILLFFFIGADAEERVAQAAHYGLVERAAFNADADGFVPSHGGVEIGGHEPVHVVADIGWQFACFSHHESGAAVQGAHEAHANDDGIAFFNHPHRRARQAIFGAGT
jgi:hypothetical protein